MNSTPAFMFGSLFERTLIQWTDILAEAFVHCENAERLIKTSRSEPLKN
jgi:hypothetical protein